MNSKEEQLKAAFSANLKRQIKLNHMNQSEVAEKLKVQKTTVSSWCTGVSMPSGITIQSLTEVLNCRMSDLLPDENADTELNEYLDMLRKRPEMRMLFKTSKDATKDEVEQAVKIIEAIRKK